MLQRIKNPFKKMIILEYPLLNFKSITIFNVAGFQEVYLPVKKMLVLAIPLGFPGNLVSY